MWNEENRQTYETIKVSEVEYYWFFRLRLTAAKEREYDMKYKFSEKQMNGETGGRHGF